MFIDITLAASKKRIINIRQLIITLKINVILKGGPSYIEHAKLHRFR